jgi:uncharacterized membrane protein
MPETRILELLDQNEPEGWMRQEHKKKKKKRNGRKNLIRRDGKNEWFNPLKTELVPLCKYTKFSSYLIENMLLLRHKGDVVNAL